MDPRQLIGPASPLGLPAPFWFIELFKVLGFTLHQTMMHLWYGGVPLAAVLSLRRDPYAVRLRTRLLVAMPVIVAFGINLGVVPLLFTQVAYYRVFYPAGVLMAWAWLSVIGLVTLAYYGVYLGSISVRNKWRPRIGRAAGWVAAALFIAIGFLFANNFSLMTNVRQWPDLLMRTSVAGAPAGTALNTADPTLIPRWLMLFGLALITTATFIGIDAAFLAGRERQEYGTWARRVSAGVGTIGLAIFGLFGTWYILSALAPSMLAEGLGKPVPAAAIILAAALPAVTWVLLVLRPRLPVRLMAALAGGAQFLALAANAAARQWVQNTELSRYLDVAEPVRMEWSPLILFLLLFVAGVGVVIWLLRRIIEVNRREAAAA
ncbi:MAG TPA: hypothetical protein VI007_06760 [bacterium]